VVGFAFQAVERRNVPTPAWWKEFYAREREGLDQDALLDRAPEIEFPEGGALVFPHTRLAVTGTMVAAVARAAARARREVLALGVLHGVRGPRGVHEETGLARDEFSLDGFRALYGRACAREGIPARIVTRYPLEVGDRPNDLPGLDELRRRAETSLLVGTADPIHHGIGYETPEVRDETLPETAVYARTRVLEQLGALARGEFSEFARICTRDRSDFRNVGPVVAALFPHATWTLDDLKLVDYSDVLGCARPTWVAAGRISVGPGRRLGSRPG
jgi:hypothetical protein